MDNLPNYWKTIFRVLRKQWLLTVMNVIGLSVGLTACLILAMYINDEFTYDKFHSNADRIVRVVMDYKMNDQSSKIPQTGSKVGPAFKRVFPEVDASVRMLYYPVVVKVNGDAFKEKKTVFADAAFFRMFSFNMISGDPRTALDGPNKIVLSSSIAKKYFGKSDPVGKTVVINFRDDVEYLVTGVVEDCPANSQIKYDIIPSFASLPADREELWWSANYGTYLMLQTPKSIESLQAKIPGYMQSQAGETKVTGGDYLKYILEPLLNVHLHSEVDGIFEPGGNLMYLTILEIIAILILLIACSNYINMSVAIAPLRSAEIAVKKILGANRRQLFYQLIGETFMITCMSFLLSLLFTAIVLPVVNNSFDKDLSIFTWFAIDKLLILFMVVIITSLLAGSYSAMLISGYSPIKSLSGVVAMRRTGVLQKSLVVFQFTITGALIVFTINVNRQMSFVQSKQVGYDKNHVISLSADQSIRENLPAIKSELTKHASIRSVTMASEDPTFVLGGYKLRRASTPEAQSKLVSAIAVDEDYVKTVGLKVLAGRDLTEADFKQATQPERALQYQHLLLNEQAAKAFGWDPAKAVGQEMIFGGYLGRVEGVVKDFHFASMKNEIGPLVLFSDIGDAVVLVSFSGSADAALLKSLSDTWARLAPGRPFDYQFLSERFDNIYIDESRTKGIFMSFSFLAIFLACSGLISMSFFSSIQRRKEISIRKVLGASVLGVVLFLVRDMLILLVISMLIFSPIAWVISTRWLEEFNYRVAFDFGVLGMTYILILTLSLMAVLLQSTRAALTNPVKNIR